MWALYCLDLAYLYTADLLRARVGSCRYTASLLDLVEISRGSNAGPLYSWILWIHCFTRVCLRIYCGSTAGPLDLVDLYCGSTAGLLDLADLLRIHMRTRYCLDLAYLYTADLLQARVGSCGSTAGLLDLADLPRGSTAGPL